MTLGAVAAELGLIAFITINGVRSRVAGWVYSWGNAAAILIVLWNLLCRTENEPGAVVIPFGIILSVVVVVIFLATGWLSGELILIDNKSETDRPISAIPRGFDR